MAGRISGTFIRWLDDFCYLLPGGQEKGIKCKRPLRTLYIKELRDPSLIYNRGPPARLCQIALTHPDRLLPQTSCCNPSRMHRFPRLNREREHTVCSMHRESRALAETST
jgi:hypothetical protein